MGRGGDFDSDEAKTGGKRTKEQVQAKNRNKYKKNRNKNNTSQSDTLAGRRIWMYLVQYIYHKPNSFRNCTNLSIQLTGAPPFLKMGVEGLGITNFRSSHNKLLRMGTQFMNRSIMLNHGFEGASYEGA